MTGRDFKECLKRIENTGQVRYFRFFSSSEKPVLLQSSDIFESQESVFLGAARPAELSKLRFRYSPGQNRYVHQISQSYSIEIIRSFQNHSILRRGRFYFEPNFTDDNGERVKKDDDHIAWATKFLRVAVHGMTYNADLHAYVGAEAETLRANGQLEFSLL